MTTSSPSKTGLVVGIGEVLPAFRPTFAHFTPFALTREVLRLDDGDVMCLSWDSVSLYSVADSSRSRANRKCAWEMSTLCKKGGYAHFMLKEIRRQPQVAHRAAAPPAAMKTWARSGDITAHNLAQVGWHRFTCAARSGFGMRGRQAGRRAVLAPQFHSPVRSDSWTAGRRHFCQPVR